LQFTGYLVIERCELQNIFLFAYGCCILFGVYYVVSGILIHKESKRIKKLNETVDNLLNNNYDYDIIDPDDMRFEHPIPRKNRNNHDTAYNRLVWNPETESWTKIRH
tara:strand:- start:3826 stop:4146 length:321 start_codon:yes stop_codon:yes gene_type:complete